MASARGKWNELNREWKGRFGKVEGEQVVLRDVADAQRSLGGHGGTGLRTISWDSLRVYSRKDSKRLGC